VYAYRFKNVSSMKAYLENPVTVCEEREEWTEITKKDAMEEFMYLGLRMRKGISEKEFFEKFKEVLEEVYGDVLLKFHSMNLLEWNGEKGERQIYLTDQGIDVSNAILCEFLLS
ncbi:MAG: coproporphyrinogen III oxidase, partial [Clostridiales bacterium]|nr:coproporphyrinogen III oxidase [Clostridiales bacterium]